MPDSAEETPVSTGYRRSRDTARGRARRRELLALVTDDVQAHGLADFSLRRAARAAGTTHKVLLYYFQDADDLLQRAVAELRQRRIQSGLAVAAAQQQGSLVERVWALWPVLIGDEDSALEQAMGLAMYDPVRYAGLVAGATADYLQALQDLCPETWAPARKAEVAQLVLAALRGLLLARRTTADDTGAQAGRAALERALLRELAADA